MSEYKTNTRRIKYKKPADRKINYFPNGDEVVDLIIENLQKEIDEHEQAKKTGIQFWTDFQYARWDSKRYLLKEHMTWLKELSHDIELADIEHDMAIDGAEVPF